MTDDETKSGHRSEDGFSRYIRQCEESNRDLRNAGDLSVVYWVVGMVGLVSGLAAYFS